jgi:hypothetical protein
MPTTEHGRLKDALGVVAKADALIPTKYGVADDEREGGALK